MPDDLKLYVVEMTFAIMVLAPDDDAAELLAIRHGPEDLANHWGEGLWLDVREVEDESDLPSSLGCVIPWAENPSLATCSQFLAARTLTDVELENAGQATLAGDG